MEACGYLKDEISTGSHSRLGNPKRQDFNKCFDPRTDQQLSQNWPLPFAYLGREEKKEKRSTLKVLSCEKNQMRITTFFQKDLTFDEHDCRISQLWGRRFR